MSLEDKLAGFNPNRAGNLSNNIFSLPFEVSESQLVFIPVPWDVTASSKTGTCNGPQNIFNHSFQIDLFDPLAPNAWKKGMAMEKIEPVIKTRNQSTRKQASRIIQFLEGGGETDDHQEMQGLLKNVNQACESLMLELEMKCLQYVENGQIPFLMGGDHSISTGLIRALAREESFGILQIDAHADMRESYQGFTHSHASVMHNAINTEGVERIVQVGIRELCTEEVQMISKNHRTIKTYFGHDLHQRLFEGENWSEICQDIVNDLPDNVYISFDVDGLEPAFCPGTGTPVPGGLSFNQAIYLLETAFNAGKRFIGADLVETGEGRLDGIISARILYRIAGMLIKSNE
ncbi:MAG: agmatinase [Bacteroidia bacterium]|nr:MAG: agmatinase [Bacteroidia bacterium]